MNELRSKLAFLGIELAADEDRLVVRARTGVITPELQNEIAHSKQGLLALLSAEAASRDGPSDLVRIPRDGPLPLSSFQERLWVIHQLDPDNTAYNMVLAWPSARETSLMKRIGRIRGIVRRHEIFYTVFSSELGGPIAKLSSPEAVPVEAVDLAGIEPVDQGAKINGDRIAEAHRPFDLVSEPAVRFTVYDIGGGRVVTLLAAHHIVLDAWSATLLQQEIEAEAGPEEASADGCLQYVDYAAWQRRSYESIKATADLDWWARHLAGIPQLSAFPADHTPAAHGVGSSLEFEWDRALADGVAALAHEHGATLYMALVAACAAVLGRHAHQHDIVLGSPTGTRELRELETMIGPFVNLLMLRLDLSDDPTFSELLARARTAVFDAHDHSGASFERILERLRPSRTFNRSPIFQVAVVLHNATGAAGPIIQSGGAIHDMTWFVRETKDGFAGSLEYRTDIYSAVTVKRVLRHLEMLLRSAISKPGVPISQLGLISPEERQALLALSKAPNLEIEFTPFTQQFERQVRSAPDRPAIAFEDSTLTYDELNRRANRIARHVISLGVCRGDKVGICLKRGFDMVAALLAIQKCGAAYVPLDPAHPAERLNYMLEDSGTKLLVTTAETPLDWNVPPSVRLINLDVDSATIAGLDDADLPEGPAPDSPVYMIYTSGSTGRPKGVEISHRNLANFLGSMRREPGISPDDIVAAITTISFDIAGLELYLPLLVGAQIELIDHDTATDGELLAAKLRQRRVTLLQATPSTWRLLIEADWRGGERFCALCGGESLARDVADDLIGRVGSLWNMYGPTETTVWSTLDRVSPGNSTISIGRPIANTEVYILGQDGEPSPIGVPGEIFIGGEGVAIGYHNRPELTTQRFLPDNLSGRTGARLYATGDLGRCGNDGRFYHLGRLDTQVKIRGMRIELGEIETVLRMLPEIQSGVVVAHQPAPGEGRLVAYVVYRPGQDLTVSEVRRQLRRTVPDYMVPSLVVTLDALPLTANGKLDRKALPDPFNSGNRHSASPEPLAPGIEHQMAEIWREFLSVDQIGAEDNFFELGGHSLLSLRVAAETERRFGRRLDPRSLFFQSLRQISANLANAPVSTRGRIGTANGFRESVSKA